MRLVPLLASLALVACGTAEPIGRSDTSPAGMSEAIRNGSAVDLLRGRYPSLRIDEAGNGLGFQIRQYGHPPVLVVDGFRSPAGDNGLIEGLRASDIVEIRVLKTLAETMVYGEEAALGGVIEIKTRLAPRD